MENFGMLGEPTYISRAQLLLISPIIYQLNENRIIQSASAAKRGLQTTIPRSILAQSINTSRRKTASCSNPLSFAPKTHRKQSARGTSFILQSSSATISGPHILHCTIIKELQFCKIPNAVLTTSPRGFLCSLLAMN